MQRTLIPLKELEDQKETKNKLALRNSNFKTLLIPNRIRPQLAKERIDMCRVCTSVTPGENQVMLGQDRAFTFDNVFDMDSQQYEVYNSTAHSLIEGCFDGYNATVFAYGQTGSGKTFTMGTGFEPGIAEEQQGIVPRAVGHLFSGIEQRRNEALQRSEPPPEFKIHAQFMELYNEEILDLFDSTRDVESSRNKKSHIKIHEDAQGGIYVVGVTTRTVASEQETLVCLKGGALSRTTASTNMNTKSSRSHAIFTLHIKQQRLVKVSNEENEEEQQKTDDNTGMMNEFETLTAKFHFVDLAGSERLKRTGATGDRAKEGISINCGLLALGNVISALGDPTKRSSHVPYRDSKLTRLLQDSLGGNSQTLMIACISPSDRDFMETLNTLRYANRAKNIKNVVVANQDKTSRQLAALRSEVRQLQEELLEYKQGKRQVNAEGVEEINDLFHENTMLQTEIENLRQRVKAMQETIDSQTSRIAVLVAEQARWGLSSKIKGDGDGGDEMMSMVEGYIKEIEKLRAKLVESESLNAVLRRKNIHESPSRASSRSMMSPTHIPMTSSSADYRIEAEIPENSRVASILAEARKHVEHDQERMRVAEAAKERRASKSRLHSHSDKENESDDEKEDLVEKEDGTTERMEREELTVDDEDVGEDGDEEDDDEDKDSSESDSEDEDEEAQLQLQEDLADLACEINIKQRLIEELETSQRRLQTLKAQYEEKMMSLQDKIRETEMERDKILTNMGSLTETKTKEKAEKIRKEFEIKLKKLSIEKDRMQKASKEHSKLLKNKSQFERQMKILTGDLSKMKETKVKLMRQIREEQQRSREKDVASNRAIQKLKKESRKHESRIKSLEAEAKHKEIVLKRRQEEVQHLRKLSKPMSDKVAGRVSSRRPQSQQQQDTAAKSNGPATSLQAITAARRKHPLSAASQKRRHERKGTSEYSSRAAKQKWTQIERRVTDIVNRRQTITHMERDMERYLHHRQRLSKKREKTFRRRDEAVRNRKDATVISELNDQIDGLNANIEYVQEQITECQANIMEVMEGKDEVDAGDVAVVIDNCSLQEAKYMLEHFLQLTINKGQHASQKESQVKELEAKLHQEEQNSFLQQQLLQHVLSGQEELDVEFDGLYVHPEPESSSSAESSRAPSPVETSASTQNAIQNHANTGSLPPFDYHQLPTIAASHIPVRSTRDKARRRTATQEELLYAGSKDSMIVSDSTPLLPLMESSEPSGDDSSQSSIILPPPRLTAARKEKESWVKPGQRSDSASPLLRKKLHNILQPQPLSSTPTGSVEHTPDPSPPSSPPPSSKARSDNVFSRLTQSNSPATSRNGSKQTEEDDGGIINPVLIRPQGKTPLVCSYTAEGHTKAVLSVQATNDLLFSGSKDRTVKVWKLETGQELTTLSGHPNNVVVVRYSEKLSLVFSVSTAYIRVWDIREPAKCIKTLSSSGHVLDSSAGSSVFRTVALPTGESQINDIAVNDTGTRLYAAAGNIIRVWSLSNFQAICKLFGGPSAAIMCVAVDTQEDCDYVFAGSKDHYIKVFEVPSGATGCLTAKHNLDPPHYDGIQSIAIHKQLLFSGSRDACIKKWDIEKKQQLKTINSAHKDWICALDFLPGRDCLLSGCRGGYLKLWHMWDCSLIGEMKAHTSPINSIATNATHIFTASSDRTISVWKPQGAMESTNKENGSDS